MSKLKIGLTLLFSALGVFGVNEYYKPRNVRDLLKWQGVQLSSDGNVWKSMFFEHQEELLKKNIKNDTELWKWCEERFNSSNLGDTQIVEEARKFCSDNPTSIMARIIRDGEEDKVINEKNNKAFQINFILAGGSKEVLNSMGLNIEDISKTSDVAKEIAKWCEGQKKEKVVSEKDLDKYGNFKKRCYNYNKGINTIGELLGKQGRRKKTDSEFQKSFEKLQNSPALREEIQAIEEERKAALKDFIGPMNERIKEEGWRKYQWWCQKNLKTELIAEGIYQNSFGAIRERCTEAK